MTSGHIPPLVVALTAGRPEPHPLGPRRPHRPRARPLRGDGLLPEPHGEPAPGVAGRGRSRASPSSSQLKQEKVDLTGQLRDASSPASLEREARRLGMVKPGEHAYVVKGLGD